MSQLYTPGRSANVWRRLALAALLATGVSATSAVAQQLNYTPASSTNVAGTYTDLGTTGTAITTSALDDASSAAQPIGFTFNYNGQAFTQFILNTNGWLKLGSTAPTTDLGTWEYNSDLFFTNTADQNIIAAFGADLTGSAAAGTEYRVTTTGTAPNRVCTIQWKNVSDKALSSGTTTLPTQYSSANFQVKLYETTNVVELVYGTFTASTGTPTGRGANAGLKGSGVSTGQVTLAAKNPSVAWSNTTFINTPYTTTNQALAFVSTTLPDAGRTVRFSPAQTLANDSEVQRIYSLSKLPRLAGSPHVVQALVRNTGTNAQSGLAVRLTVSGATTYTNSKAIGSLPAGGTATVTFDGYTPASVGNNTLTVELVLPDDNAANNTKTFTQAVTADTYRYDNGTPGSFIYGAGTGSTTGAGANVVKYTAAGTRTITALNINLSTATASTTVSSSVGRTVYGVALDAAGNVVGRTPDYVIVAADVTATAPAKTFTFATPAAVGPGDFYVGLVSLTPTGSLPFYPLILSDEDPTRTGAFFSIRNFSTTGAQTLVDNAASNPGLPMIEAVLGVATGVSKAMDNAISVYPNPSTGKFTLAINGVGAAAGLKVEVTNGLGQRVYTGTVRDNFSNQLDLSGLANGMYTLKVQNGTQYMVRNISVQK